MKIYKIGPIGFAANSYFLTQDGKNAVAVDPAQPRIASEAEKRGLTVRYALFTHGHFDHIGGAAALQSAGAKIGCPEKECELALHFNLARELGGTEIAPFKVDFTLNEGETTLCGIAFRIIETPGHTAGGVCYLAENSLFTGDTLFQGSIGRSDLPTGSGAQLERSVKKLYALAGDFAVYPGHGDDTSLEYERKYNAFIRL